MKLNWSKLSSLEKLQFYKMSTEDRYKYMLLIQKGSPYGWGKESPETADCSGAVCLAIMAGIGKGIRTTANGLYHEIFTEAPNGIDVAFYQTKKPQKHGNRTVPDGHIVHVAGFVDKGVVLNMTPPKAKIQSIESFTNYGDRYGFKVIIRGASMSQLRKHDGILMSGIDQVIDDLFKE